MAAPLISLFPDTTMRPLLAATKAFSDPTRIRVIAALRSGELCVCELCDVLGVVQSTLSTHLQYLRNTGLVETRNDGKWVYYSLTKELARVADALFKIYRSDLEQDALLGKDAEQLEKRLALRKKDNCCLGSKPKQPAARRRNVTARRP